MLTIFYSILFVSVAISIAVYALSIWKAHKAGKTCDTCRFDMTGGDCGYGMGWEPQPFMQCCSLWEGKDIPE